MEYNLLLEHIILLGFIATAGGFISALAGSSGMLILPSLLLTGIPVSTAIGTTKLYTTISLLSSTLTFIQNKVFDYRYWLATGVATLVGGAFGVALLQLFDPSTLGKVVPLLLIVSACFSLFNKKVIPQKIKIETNAEITKKPIVNFFSVILGVYSGFIGAGTSLLWLSLLRQLFNYNLFQATAIANFMSFISNISALITFFVFGQVSIYLGVFLALAGAAGSYLGAKVAISRGTKLIKPMIVFTTCAVSLKLIVSA